MSMSQLNQITEKASFLVAVAGLSATIIIGLNLLYELGYFNIVGFKYFSIVSAADYIRNAVIWSVFLVPVFFFFGLRHALDGLAEAFIRNRVGALARQKIFNTPLNQSFIKDIEMLVERQTVVYFGIAGFACFLVCCAAFLWIYTSYPDDIAPKIVFFFFVVTVIRISLHRFISLFYRDKLSIRNTTIIMLLCFFVAFGADKASSQMRSNGNYYIKSTDPAGERAIRLLRMLDRGVLFVNSGDNSVEFLPWDDVKGVVMRRPR